MKKQVDVGKAGRKRADRAKKREKKQQKLPFHGTRRFRIVTRPLPKSSGENRRSSPPAGLAALRNPDCTDALLSLRQKNADWNP